MSLHWPQITWFVLVFLGMASGAHRHGKVPTEPYNFFTKFVATLVSAFLLYCGGFFTGCAP